MKYKVTDNKKTTTVIKTAIGIPNKLPWARNLNPGEAKFLMGSLDVNRNNSPRAI
ncbi:hypothetical protein GCM10020331_009510 [Ectobacillus funiculus]